MRGLRSTLRKAWVARVRFLEDSVEKDIAAVAHIPTWSRLVFVLTNIPYFLVALRLFTVADGFAVGEGPSLVASYVCSTPLFIAILVLAIAIASTTMHTAQMRLGTCFCSSSTGKEKFLPRFHSKDALVLFKHLDVGCVFMGLIGSVLCCGLLAMSASLAPVAPVFVKSMKDRSKGFFQSYMIYHGLWHVLSAAIIWYNCP
mmetsp:Transcript_16576/g.20474  ORF Transcript_16576/g.20474 Transcript_16576/m.20474 type:complete len:201 (-) Transcript_16576:24-626(-)